MCVCVFVCLPYVWEWKAILINRKGMGRGKSGKAVKLIMRGNGGQKLIYKHGRELNLVMQERVVQMCSYCCLVNCTSYKVRN